jgi:tetratricopeptide (TPR) repeat protein
MLSNLFGKRKDRSGTAGDHSDPDESRDDPDQSCDEHNPIHSFLVRMWILAAIGCLLILLYSSHFSEPTQLLRILGMGMLLAGAALLSGFLLGFIFAIPRLGEQKAKAATAQPKDSPAADNLVQISDWLTKIIVGVGLVELHSIPRRLGTLSYYLALGLQPASSAGGGSGAGTLAEGQVTGLAILVFYSTLGFLLGYVWTMIYLKMGLQGLIRTKKELQRFQRDVKDIMPPKVAVILRAEASLNANKLDEAMATIDEVLRNDPQNGFALMTKARILKRQAFKSQPPDKEKLKEAIARSGQAIALLPNKGEPFYNKACYQALLDLNGLKSEILANLEAAFRLNPGLRQDAKVDEDLAPMRQDDEFKRVIGEN